MSAKQPRGGADPRYLTPKQEAVALLLAGGRTLAEAADESGTGQRTISTWLAALPAFRERVQALRGELTASAAGRLAGAMSAAVDTLRALLDGESETVRCSAARAILDVGVRVREQVELEQRLAALEQRLAEGKGRRA